MISFNLIIKVIIAASLLYFIMNAFFRYHLQNEITSAGLFFLILIVLIIYTDLNYNLFFPITITGLFIIYSVIRLYFYKQGVSYYLLLNINSNYIKRIVKANQELNVSCKTYSKFACIIKFYNYDSKSLRNLFKLAEKSLKDYKLKLTIKHYWIVILYLIIVTILWRF